MPVALARVTVQRSDGASFEVTVDEGKDRVMEVKREVEKVEGVSASLCDLFLLSEGGSGSGDEGDREGEGSTSDGGGPLSDDAKVEDGWLLALIVRGTHQQYYACREISLRIHTRSREITPSRSLRVIAMQLAHTQETERQRSL